jgi:P-type Ca2+ transporter type 2C
MNKIQTAETAENNLPGTLTGNWHLKSTDEILSELKTSEKGLTEHDVLTRIHHFGKNKIAKENQNGPLRILLKNFNSMLIYIMAGSAIISLLTHHTLEFYVITAIISLTGILGFVQEYRASKSIDALEKLTAKKVFVFRDGKEHEILADMLVPGDIVNLRRGMIVPADIRVIESKGLTTDESILTGESVSKFKHTDVLERDSLINDRSNIVFSGTSVTAGTGIGVVVETGLNSELGKISVTLKEIPINMSPLQKKIESMSRNLSIGVLTICALFFIFLLMKDMDIFSVLLLVSAVAVSGIPESFPLALTLALSKGMRNMANSNAIVKDLNAVETLGTTTVICTDKTGTLTENKMRVVKLMFPDGKEITIEGKGYDPKGIFKVGGKEINISELKAAPAFFKTLVLCNNADLKLENGNWAIAGESTEGALLTLAESAGYEDSLIRSKSRRIYEIPFDPSIKYMISVNEEQIGKSKEVTAYLKGAFEHIIDKCSHVRRRDGTIGAMSAEEKNKIGQYVQSYSNATLRVMGFATKKLSKFDPKSVDKLAEQKSKHLDSGFIFEGIVGIEDPIRSDVYDAIKTCHEAGIKVVIITGDHKATAESIGRKLGLIKNKADLIVEGQELDKMSDNELDESIRNVAVFARTTPSHKLRIVSSLQRNGEIVAMTGDGVNDAPALKKADIGVSMGKNGTDVAREASNMVLSDDNFSTIVKAVREGRSIYSNIRRFVYYLLSGNFTEVSLMVMTTLIGIITPFSAIMILFVNIVTSTFPSLALSIEPAHLKIMKQRPRNPKEKLLSNYILLKTLVIVPLMFAGTLLLFIWELSVNNAGIQKAQTVAFASLILFELFNAYNSRSLHTTIFNKNFFKNKMMFIASGISFMLLLICVYTPAGHYVFKTVPLTITNWIGIFTITSLIILFTEVIKLLIKSEFEEQGKLKGIELRIE